MTLYNFNKLDELEQHETIQDSGVHIGLRNDGEHKIDLYQFFSFYIDLCYQIEYNALRKLKTLSNTGLLDDYLPNDTF